MLPGRHILSDVAVVHPLGMAAVSAKYGQLAAVRMREEKKRKKYEHIAAARQFEQLPFVLETTGGFGPSAEKLIRALAEAAEERLAVWPKTDVIRELLGSVAMAVQRGGALAYLYGYDRCLLAVRAAAEAV